MSRAKDLASLANQQAITTYGSNIGIGTTVATSTLTVVGNALHTGVITATKFYGDGSGLTNTPQGVQGLQGLQGSQGSQGVQGPQGLAGLFAGQGTQGLQGSQGSQGVQGLQGLAGLFAGQGTQGTQGLQGLQGTQGNQGSQGVSGSFAGKGDPGSQGVQGQQGLQGTQGAQGLQGVQGLSGLFVGQGVQGTQGPFGFGLQGAQGLSGIFAGQGAQGLSGLFVGQGAQGVQGTSNITLLSTNNNWTGINSFASLTIFADTPGNPVLIGRTSSLQGPGTSYIGVEVSGINSSFYIGGGIGLGITNFASNNQIYRYAPYSGIVAFDSNYLLDSYLPTQQGDSGHLVIQNRDISGSINGIFPGYQVSVYSDSSDSEGELIFNRAGGDTNSTANTPFNLGETYTVQDNTHIGSIVFRALGGNAAVDGNDPNWNYFAPDFANAAVILGVLESRNVTGTGNRPTAYLSFQTRSGIDTLPYGYNANTERLRIHSGVKGGVVGIGTSTVTGTSNQLLQVGSSVSPAGAYISGSVGIATTNPSTTLQVNGTLTATDIRFKSVAEKTVLVNGSTVNLVYNTGAGNMAICTSTSGDVTLNVTGIPTDTTFDNNSITFSVIISQTGIARSCTAVTLNGYPSPIKWAGTSLANAIVGATTAIGYDIYSFTGINTIGSASTTANYVVLGHVGGQYR